MNLREIIAITGRPGLFKLVSQGNSMLIVESLVDKKRMPVGQRDKIVSLGDIAMYTEGDDLPLGEILDRVYAKYEGKPIDVKEAVKNGTLRDLFAEVVEDYDRDRVYPTDIKKLFTWYNILTAAGYDKFTPDAPEEESEVVEDTSAD